MTTKKATKPAKKAITKTETAPVICLDLGCGENKQTVESIFQNGLITEEQKANAQVIGVDNQKVPGVDKVWDLTKFPYPFKDNSIDAVYTSHFLEHLDGPARIKFMDEMYRILKMGAKMKHIHPHHRSSRAVQDPTHAWPPLCDESYLYFNKAWREANKLGHYLGKSNFDFQTWFTWQDQTWPTKNEDARNYAMRYLSNVVADMVVMQTKI